MTVVHFVVGNSFGGAEGHICTLVKLMKESGISFKIVCNNTAFDEFKKRLEGYNVEIISLDLFPRPNFKEYFSLIKVFRELSPDIVHCHLYSATRFGALAAKLANVNVVIETIHIEEVWRKGLKKWLFCSIDALNGRLFVDHYIAVSNAVSFYYQKYKAVPGGKVTTIYNTTTLEDVKIYRKNFSFRIGFLGRLTEQKGIDTLIKAVASIRRKGGDCKLFIGGSGPLLSELKQQVHLCGIEDAVNFLGNVSDKNKFFGMIDIFVLPSRYEGFPLVLLEAGTYRMPVVATKVSGNPEIIHHGETGLLVECNNPEELASAILEYEDSKKRELLSENLEKLVKSNFNQTRYKNKMETFYLSFSS